MSWFKNYCLILLICLISQAWGIYNDTIARYTLWPLSMNAYMTDPKELKECINANPDYEFIDQVTVICITQQQTCSGFVVVSHSKNTIFIVFRGTQVTGLGIVDFGQQLLDEILSTWDEPLTQYNGGGAVNKYFYGAFDNLWRLGMQKAFHQARQKYPKYDVWITGHSLGGAMAAIAAPKVNREKNKDTKLVLYTFGEPRVGNFDFAKTVERSVNESYRVVHGYDPISQLPWRNYLGYYHHGKEIWYDKMDIISYTQCYQNCGESLPKHEVNPLQHITFYGQHKDILWQSCISFS